MGRVTALHRGMAQGLVLILASIGMLAVGASPAHASSASEFVAKINAARADAGRSALTVRGDLAAAAQAQAERMAARSELFHNPNLGGSVTNWSSLAENVGYGPDVATIHQAFMRSPGHRANILQTKYTEVGVGVVMRGPVMWVAEVFRLPKSSPAKAAPAKKTSPHTSSPAREPNKQKAQPKPASPAATPVKATPRPASAKARSTKATPRRAKARPELAGVFAPPTMAVRVLALDLKPTDLAATPSPDPNRDLEVRSGRDSGAVRAEVTVTFAVLALVALVGVARTRLF